MIAKKCFLIMRRLIDLGPKNTMLLLYYKWRKRRFMARHTNASIHFAGAKYSAFDAIFHDPAWRSTWPNAFCDAQAIYQKADATVARNFTILGFGTFSLPTPLPWQSDFISPFMSACPPELVERRRDVKVPWELSRFDYLFTLGMAYQQAQKDNDHDRASRYVHTFTSLITEWIEHNPCYDGANWVCPMEVAIRVINWIWGFYFFHKESMIPESFWEQLNTALVQHAEYLYNTWEFSDRPNNHYLSDLVGFVYVSTFLGDTKRCESVIKKLLAQINYQIHTDGSCYEGSTAYHRLDTELVLLTILLLKHTERDVPAWLEERYKRMQQFFADCSPTPESLVLVGDNDSGKIITQPSPRSQATAGRLGVSPVCPESTCARRVTYPGFGLTIINTKHWHITFRHASYRPHQPTGHFHNDQLAITLFDDGDPVFIDPGTISYTGDPELRNTLRSISYHNTFCIKDHEPENTRLRDIDLFVLPRKKHTSVPEIIERQNSFYMRDYHDGYAFLGLTAQRTLEVLGDAHECIITDCWLANIMPDLHSSWAFIVAPQVTVEKRDEKKWIVKIKDKERLTIESSLPFTVMQAYCSSVYGKKESCYMLKASMKCDDKEHTIRIKRITGY